MSGKGGSSPLPLSVPMRGMERLLQSLHPEFNYRIIRYEGGRPLGVTGEASLYALSRRSGNSAIYVSGVRGEHQALLTFGAIVRGIKLEKMHAKLLTEDDLTRINNELIEIENA